MENVKLTAKVLQPLFAIFAVLYLWFTVSGTLNFALLSPEYWAKNSLVHPDAQIALTTRLTYLVTRLLHVPIGLLAIIMAIGIMRLVQSGLLFDARIANRFRWAGFAVALSSALAWLTGSCIITFITWHNPQGPTPPELYFSIEAAALILCGGGFYLVGWIMGEAITLAHDNEGFV
jgi:hypothetical protein